ncbi:uncharacterized protein LOC142624985 [Castanea sativa]|uniref:uncharacterized protein LOC142624985 n=1 Tax=Castanea sativa TaxID=21020 RepID=UPI003F64EAEB
MGRIAKWGTMFGAFDVKYMPLIAIKGQILADFVAEFNEGTIEKEEKGLGMMITSAIVALPWEVNGEFKARDKRMQGYFARVQYARAQFKIFVLKQIARGQNSHANSLAMLVTSLGLGIPWVVVVEEINNSSLTGVSLVGVYSLYVGTGWMDPIVAFLKQGLLPEGKCEVEKWGLDIVGPFPRAIGNRRWLLVDTDYFTKWVEAESLANIRDMDAKRFIWKNIVTRFGVPHTLISDNGLQFDSKAFQRYYGELDIRNKYSTLTYLQGNGQAETINKVIVSGLKKRLDNAKGKWEDELPYVLWTYCTTPRRSTRETPFSMTYGAEAVIPLESGFPTLRTDQFNIEEKNCSLLNSLDVAEERRKVAMVKMSHYQQKHKQGYDKGIKLRSLALGDLVLRKVVGTAKNLAWESWALTGKAHIKLLSLLALGLIT